MVSKVLTSAQVASLEENGYLVVENFIDGEEVSRIRNRVAALYEGGAGYDQGDRFDLVGYDDGSEPAKIVQLMDANRYDPGLRKSHYLRMATQLATQVLGPGARLLSDHVVVKPAFADEDTPPHQDEAYRNPNFSDPEISIWLALQPVDERNGCMGYLPKSHRGGVRPHQHLHGDPKIHALECVEHPPLEDFVKCPLAAGGITIHTARTVHRSGPNLTGATRYAYVAIFDAVRVNATPSYFPWNASKEARHLERQKTWLDRGGKVVRKLRLLRKARMRDLLRDLRQRWELRVRGGRRPGAVVGAPELKPGGGE